MVDGASSAQIWAFLEVNLHDLYYISSPMVWQLKSFYLYTVKLNTQNNETRRYSYSYIFSVCRLICLLFAVPSREAFFLAKIVSFLFGSVI
jgi:hypothetical protein